MGVTEAVGSVLGKYAQFSGRARRSEYWWWTLAVFVVGLVADFVDLAVHSPLLQIVLFLATVLPSLAVGVRRLHDTGKSGWFLLVGFIPLVGTILVLVWLCGDSARGANQYGPDPKGGYSDPPTGYGQQSTGFGLPPR